jgi:hypothetical protein
MVRYESSNALRQCQLRRKPSLGRDEQTSDDLALSDSRDEPVEHRERHFADRKNVERSAGHQRWIGRQRLRNERGAVDVAGDL